MRNGVIKICIIFILIKGENCSAATIPSSSIAFKFYSGISFSKTTLNQDKNNITKKSLLGLQAEFSFNYLFKNGDILEGGLRYKMIGHKIFPSEKYGGGVTIFQSFNGCLPIIYHKKIGFKEKGFYLSLGALFTRGPGEEYSLTSGYSLYYQTSDVLMKNKFHLLFGSRYIFKIKDRSLGIELVYTKGFNNYYQSVTHNIFDNRQNRYINKGSGIHIGLVYFFKNKKKSTKA